MPPILIRIQIEKESQHKVNNKHVRMKGVAVQTPPPPPPPSKKGTKLSHYTFKKKKGEHRKR